MDSIYSLLVLPAELEKCQIVQICHISQYERTNFDLLNKNLSTSMQSILPYNYSISPTRHCNPLNHIPYSELERPLMKGWRNITQESLIFHTGCPKNYWKMTFRNWEKSIFLKGIYFYYIITISTENNGEFHLHSLYLHWIVCVSRYYTTRRNLRS